MLQTSDGYVLKQMIYDHYLDLSSEQWWSEFKQIIMFKPQEGTKGDLFSHIASYLIGNVLRLPSQYFVLVSLLYGWFYLSSLEAVLTWQGRRYGLIFWSIIVLFVSYRFVDSMQSVRTYTGAWILFYGVIQFYRSHKWKYVVLMLSSVLFHFAFFILVIPALVAILARKLPAYAIISIYIFSFFINLPVDNLILQLQQTELGQEKVAGYYKEDPDAYISTLETDANWYKKYGRWVLSRGPHFILFLLIILGFNTKSNFQGIEWAVFTTAILFAVLGNLGNFIPVFYNRAMVNSGMYATALLAMLAIRNALYDPRKQQIFRRFLILIVIVLFVPYEVYVLSNMTQFTSIYMITLPVLGLFDEINLSIREFLGFFI